VAPSPGRATKQSEEGQVSGFKAFLAQDQRSRPGSGRDHRRGHGRCRQIARRRHHHAAHRHALGEPGFLATRESCSRPSTDPTKEVCHSLWPVHQCRLSPSSSSPWSSTSSRRCLIREAPKEPEPPTKTCQYCKETVPADATKCPGLHERHLGPRRIGHAPAAGYAPAAERTKSVPRRPAGRS